MNTNSKFYDQEPPIINPNPKNDTYENNNVSGVGIIIAIFFVLGCVIIVCANIYFKGHIYVYLYTFLAGAFQILKALIRFGYIYVYRKMLINNGTSYPAVLVKVDEINENGCVYYTLYFKTACKSYVFARIQLSPEKYLENPYCTVYEMGRKSLVSDFKVYDKYIKANGKLR